MHSRDYADSEYYHMLRVDRKGAEFIDNKQVTHALTHIQTLNFI